MHPSIHVVDWLVFGAVLLISLLVGVYQACSGGKQKTSGEYLLGNRNLPFIPTTISLTVSFISTNNIIGFAAETYSNGAQYIVTVLGYILGVLMAIFIFIPIFYPLHLVSVNEYLLLRYDSRLVHIVGSVLTVWDALNFSGTVLYGASAAIEAMSGFSAQWAIVVSGVICTIYTTIGGIKAVIWTDVFQAIIMFCGLIYVTVSGIMVTSGSSVIQVSKRWGRLNFFEFDPNPTKRLNFYACIFGEAFTAAGVFGYIQAGVQRYANLPTIKQAKWSSFATIPGHITMNVVSSFVGLIVFTFYTNLGCDPFRAKYIPSPNHILPYFMATEIAIPALTGLFLACLISSSLSTASSSLNASAANTWEDLLKYWFPDISEDRKSFWLKALVAGYGVIAILVALAVTLFTGIIDQIIMTISSCLQGPASGLFFIGAFIPWVNWKGASVGGISGFLFGLWLVIGSFYSEAHWQPLPTNTDNCTAQVFQNISDTLTTTSFNLLGTTTPVINGTLGAVPEITGIARLYNVSFLWKRQVVAAFTIGVSLIVSLITGIRRPGTIPPHLVHPLIRRFVGKDITKEENDAYEFQENPEKNSENECTDKNIGITEVKEENNPNVTDT